MDRFIRFLHEIAPYVIVVGSFARNGEHDESDIDCFLRSRPCREADPDKPMSETYMPEILEIIRYYDYVTDSVIVGHIDVEKQPGVPRMVEISDHYRIPYTNRVFMREICGVPFLCAADNKECPYKMCYENTEWDDKTCGMIIKHPLPDYPEL